MEFTVSDSVDHVVIFDFNYDGERVEEHRVVVTNGQLTKTGHFTLHPCNEVS